MSSAASDFATWPEGIVQLLDDHHLVVLSDSPKSRRRFSETLSARLGLLSQTQIVSIDGHLATDLPSFCRQLEGALEVDSLNSNPWWRDMHSVIEVMRNACSGNFGNPPKRRYYLWHEADAMLEADVELFCRLVNALLGVAAECEHVSLDPFVLQRVVFIGGAKLGAYAEDSTGQFCKWLEDEEGSPFWEIASIVERPPVMAYRIDG